MHNTFLGSKLRTRLSPKLKRKLIQFLWAYTACPILQKWRDLGIRFWPRWLKEGHCESKRSCSIPPSMTCSPSEAEYKVLLVSEKSDAMSIPKILELGFRVADERS